MITAGALKQYAYETFSLLRPGGPAFWRKATCDEVSCTRKANGWRTVLDLDTLAGRRQATWIVDHSGRHGSIERVGNVVTMTFAAGQDCFEPHRVALEREPIYIVRDGGVRREVPGGRRRVHQRGVDWVDNMQEDLDKIRTARERG
jgi:hypothetical protein